MADQTLGSHIAAIESGRWKRALFTTYALSLTFFESYILPKLRSSGCERVTILVDHDGYIASLMELRSKLVGYEYSLVPVKVKGGIFHPKIMYLWGDTQDVLLVGSGNLTFGGHGRNVEVLEALDSGLCQSAFGDFSEFLKELRVAERLAIPEVAELADFEARARSHAKELAPIATDMRLLHTLHDSISEQIRQIASSETGWRELLVLSPFHHPDGEPVLTLAKALGVRNLVVGVPSGGHASSFPFHAADAWDIPVSIVCPDVEKPRRPLHAKWIELRGKRTLSVTGSVNATAQSLGTTANVEVAVLRQLSKPSRDLWKDAKRPSYVADEFEPTAAGVMLVVADLEKNGVLVGRIFGSDQLAGDWQAALTCIDETRSNALVPVTADGRFRWRLDAAFEFEWEAALQIHLRHGERNARGWVSVQASLGLPSRSRVTLQALSRLLSRSDTVDDISALLDFAALEAGRLVERAIGPSRATAASTDEPPDFIFPVAELSLRERPDADLLRDFATHSASEGRSALILNVIARLLLGQRMGKGPSVHVPRRQDDGDDDDDSEQSERDEAARQSALARFNEHIEGRLSTLPQSDPRLANILLVWGSVNLHMRIRSGARREQLLAFLDEWLRKTSGCTTSAACAGLLDEMVAGSAAALASAAGAYAIHDRLEAYVRGSVDEGWAADKAFAWFLHPTANTLVRDEQKAAVHALREALHLPTRRGVMVRIIDAAARRVPIQLPANTFSPAETALIKHFLAAPPGRQRVWPVSHRNLRGCPKCGHQLRASRSTLAVRRIDQCTSCNSILISVEP